MQHPNNDKMTTVIPKEDLEAALNNPTIKGVLTRVYKLFVVSFGAFARKRAKGCCRWLYF